MKWDGEYLVIVRHARKIGIKAICHRIHYTKLIW